MTTVLQKMLETGSLPHPLLLIHAELSDAIDLSKKLMGPNHHAKIDSGNHPDLHLYRPEEKSDLYLMANIQKLIQEMALPPFEAPLKVFILEEAEKMLPSASNALLKTLEEPSEDSFVILLSHRRERLLPTILSRLHPIDFSPPETAPVDLGPFFALAQKEDWVELLEALSQLEEEKPESLFQGFLQQVPSQDFSKALALVREAQLALQHNVKLRTVLLHLFLSVTQN